MKLALLVSLIVCAVVLSGGIVFLILRYQKSDLFSQPDPSEVTTNEQRTFTPLIYGYLPYWTRSTARFPDILTHVSYFSLAIQADGKLLNIPPKNQEAGYRAYQAGVLQNLRTELPAHTKLELTITMMDQQAIPVFVQSSQAHEQFITDLEKIIKEAPISGVNIDIEYNGLVDETLQEQFAVFIRSVSTLLHAQTPPKHFSIASYSDAGTIRRLTDLHRVEPYVDHIVMMAYDYHRSLSPQAGPNSPLYGKKQKKWDSDIVSDLAGYITAVPAHKILLGVPFYGYQWQIEDGSNPNSFTIPKTGTSITYQNIVPLLADPSVRRTLDPLAFSPYLLFTQNGKTQVIYYDDHESLGYKLSLVREAGLGGIAIWALGYEGETNDLWDAIQMQ